MQDLLLIFRKKNIFPFNTNILSHIFLLNFSLKKDYFSFTKILLSLTLWGLFALGTATAQPQIERQLLYGEPSQDEQLEDILTLPDGGTIAVGYHWDNSLTNYYDMLILRMAANGDLMWSKSYGGSQNDYMYAIVPTTDGGFLIAGSSESNDGAVGYNRGGSDIWVFKIDAEGDSIWSNTYGGSSSDLAFDITADNAGNYYVCGTTASVDGQITDNNGVNDMWVIKLDETGNLLWQQTYGGSLSENSRAIVHNAAQNEVIIAGSTQSSDFDVSAHFGSFGNDFWIVRLQTSTGQLVWEKTFGGTAGDAAQDILLLPDGSFVVVGDILSSDGDVNVHIGQDDWWVIKIVADNIVWQTTIGGTSFEQSHALALQPDGSILVCGNSFDPSLSLPNYSYDVRIAKLNGDNGNVMWDWHWGGSQFDFANSIAVLGGDRFIMAGTTDSTDGDVGGGHQEPTNERHGNHNGWVVVFDEDGVSTQNNITAPQWPTCYPNPASDYIQLDIDMQTLTALQLDYANAWINIYAANGAFITQKNLQEIIQTPNFKATEWPNGLYSIVLQTDKNAISLGRIVVSH